MTRARRISATTIAVIAALIAVAAAARGVGHGRAPAKTLASSPASTPAITLRMAMSGRQRHPARAESLIVTRVGTGSVPTPADVDHAPPRRASVFLRTAPARASAAPRSVRVMRIHVPAEVPAQHRVEWTMHPGVTAEVLSATAGAIAAQAPDTDRAVTVVTRVPARAEAGILKVGEVNFHADSVSVIVPVELVIDRIRRAWIAPARASFGALSGEKLTLSVDVRNTGNAPDTIVLASMVPSGWAPIPVHRVMLLPGERRTVALATKVPTMSGSTAAYPEVRVHLGDSVVASVTLPVQVEDRSTRHRMAGPVLTVGTSSSVGDTIAGSPAVDFSLSGRVANGVVVNGRAGYIFNEATVDRRALSRVGDYLGGPFLSLRGQTWYGTVGNTGANISTIAGGGAYGVGVIGGASHEALSGTAFVAGVPNGSGTQVAGRGDYRIGSGSIGVAAAHLKDEGPARRGVDAVSLIGTATLKNDYVFTLEGGFRQYEGGSGAGAAFGVQHFGSKNTFAFEAAHTPGGTQAYGRSLNEMSTSYGHRFSDQLLFQSSYFNSLDRPPRTGGKYDSRGWSVAPRYAFTPDVTAELEVRQSRFESVNPTGGAFASEDYITTARLQKLGGRVQWNAGANLGTTSRTTTFGSGTSATLQAQRIGVNGGGSVAFPRVILGGRVSYSSSGAGAGFAPRQVDITLGASRIAPFNSPRAPIFRAEAELTSWLGDQPSVTIARIGTEIPLPSNLSLILDAERNPLLRAGTGSTPWILAMRLERAFGFSWAAHTPMTRGSVFQDRNGNGVRDGDEAGLAGVLIRRGNQTAVTDNAGRFALEGTDPVPVEVDPVSLPAGAVAPSVAAGQNVKTVSFGIVPTGAVAVHLIPVGDEVGRRPESQPDLLAVIARDDRGTEWYLRADSTGTVHFDALPPGHYAFVLDPTATSERLKQVGDPLVLDVKPGENIPPLELRYSPRPVRLFNGGAGTTDQGRRRR